MDNCYLMGDKEQGSMHMLDLEVGSEHLSVSNDSFASSEPEPEISVLDELSVSNNNDFAYGENEPEASISDINPFDANYESGLAITPLYDGADLTVLDAVAQYLLWFAEHPGTSKQALSDILSIQHNNILPKGNLLPASYQEAIKIVEDFLVEPIIFDVCPKDCIIFRNSFSELDKCPKCNSDRYKSAGNLVPMRSFHYLPLGPRLERIFGTSNFAQIIQEHNTNSSVLYDIHNSPMWKSAY